VPWPLLQITKKLSGVASSPLQDPTDLGAKMSTHPLVHPVAVDLWTKWLSKSQYDIQATSATATTSFPAYTLDPFTYSSDSPRTDPAPLPLPPAPYASTDEVGWRSKSGIQEFPLVPKIPEQAVKETRKGDKTAEIDLQCNTYKHFFIGIISWNRTLEREASCCNSESAELDPNYGRYPKSTREIRNPRDSDSLCI